jgi:hypothetical protein
MTKASESAHLLGNLQDKPLELLELKRPLVISLIFALIGAYAFVSRTFSASARLCRAHHGGRAISVRLQ